MDWQTVQARLASLLAHRRYACWPALALWLVFGGTSYVAAADLPREDSSASRLLEQLDRPGDLALRDVSLTDALFQISEIWQLSVVVGEGVQGRVHGAFQDAPLHEILDAILLSNGYGYRPVGSSLVVLKLEELGEVNPRFESAALTTAADLDEVLEGARLLSSPNGKLQVVKSARTLVVLDFPDRVAAIRQFVADVDQAALSVPQGEDDPDSLQVVHFHPQFVLAPALKETVESLLSAEGKSTVLLQENRLVVVDHPPNLRLVRQVIEELDFPRVQVRITALIYDIGLEDLDELGINWNNALKFRHNGSGAEQMSLGVDSLLEVPLAPTQLGGAMTFMNLSRHLDLTAVVQALKQCDQSKLLADPNVTVLDNEPAMISIVTEIPYQQLTQTQQGGNIGTTAFKDAGVKLEVTPRVANDGTVLLTVTPSFSRLTGFTEGETPQPIIDKREAKTVVRVADQQTLVIGGLRQRSDIREQSGIPGLKDLKWIGGLFRSRRTNVRESELVVFIRPEIVHCPDDGRPREHAAGMTVDSILDQIPSPPLPGGQEIHGPPVDELPPPDGTSAAKKRSRAPTRVRTARRPERPPVRRAAPSLSPMKGGGVPMRRGK